MGVEVRMWLAQILSSIPKTDFFPLAVAPFPVSIAYSMLPGVRAENSEGKYHSEILLPRCYFYNLWDCG